MKEDEKTFKNIIFNKNRHFSKNRNQHTTQNKIMKTNNCNIHIMPTKITDEDINALFQGMISIVKKKCELDNNEENINNSILVSELKKKLKEKESEIVRLKNEILFLKNPNRTR